MGWAPCCCQQAGGGGGASCPACDANQAITNFAWSLWVQSVATNSTETMYDLCMRLVGFFCGIYTGHACDDSGRPKCTLLNRTVQLSPAGIVGADDTVNGDPYYSPHCPHYTGTVAEPTETEQTEVFRYKTLCVLGAGEVRADTVAIHRLALGGATTGTFTLEGDDEETLSVAGLTAAAAATAWGALFPGTVWYGLRDGNEILLICLDDGIHAAPNVTDDDTDGTIVVTADAAGDDSGSVEPCLMLGFTVGLARDVADNTWLWARAYVEDRLGFFVGRWGQGEVDLGVPWGELGCSEFDEEVPIARIVSCEQYQEDGEYHDYDEGTYCGLPGSLRVRGSAP